MFRLGTSKKGGTRKLPGVFTEQGVAMLSSVLRGKRAIRVNITIMWVFVRLRQTIEAHQELKKKLKELEERVGKHDREIQVVFEAIRQKSRAPACGSTAN